MLLCSRYHSFSATCHSHHHHYHHPMHQQRCSPPPAEGVRGRGKRARVRALHWPCRGTAEEPAAKANGWGVAGHPLRLKGYGVLALHVLLSIICRHLQSLELCRHMIHFLALVLWQHLSVSIRRALVILRARTLRLTSTLRRAVSVATCCEPALDFDASRTFNLDENFACSPSMSSVA